VDFTLYAGNLTMGKPTTDFDNYGKSWEVTGADYQQLFKSGVYSNNSKYNYSTSCNGLHTIEAAIDLNQISGNLSNLFSTWDDTYSSVTMYWQPECGNDFLAARSAFKYTTSQTPEPGTYILLGMGLIGFGILGRKQLKKKQLG